MDVGRKIKIKGDIKCGIPPINGGNPTIREIRKRDVTRTEEKDPRPITNRASPNPPKLIPSLVQYAKTPHIRKILNN